MVEDVSLDRVEGVLVARVRLRKGRRARCGVCGRKCPRYDRGTAGRRWRALDFGPWRVFLEGDLPRVVCRAHGVVAAQVPWARHGAGHTRDFDDEVAWLATKCSKSAVCELMRCSWRTVGNVLERVWADKRADADRLDGLSQIGIDEVAYKKGHKYLIVVVDHATRRVVWMGEGRSKKALLGFFDELGEARSKAITHVTADAGSWIEAAVAERCPGAVRCLDPFHVVQWATERLDQVRRQVWNEARKTAPTNYRGDARGDAKKLKGSRWALWKNPEDLTDRQSDKLDWIAKATPKLWRAYLLKEGLRVIFKLSLQDARAALARWLAWAQRSRIGPFVELGRTIRSHRDAILSSIEHGLSNGPVESVNTKIRLMTRIAYGFKSAQSLISLAMLTLGGDPPTLPGRT